MNYTNIEKAFKSIKDKIPYAPQIAVILGSGLGGVLDKLYHDAVIPYNEIEDFPVSTVHGHKGRFVFSKINNIPVVFMQGRVHYYEGYSMQEVVMPVRIMKLMGAEKLIVTNAAGGINAAFKAGDFMIINDHINFAPNPLIGSNYDEFGTRFPDMSHAYDKKLIAALKNAGIDTGVKLHEGIYIQFTGPSFETPAEIRMCSRLGADAVGMSTACEVITANHAGMRVCGLSCISNIAAGLSSDTLSHEDVNDTTEKIKDVFAELMTNVINKIAEA